MKTRQRRMIGIDAGKGHHRAVGIDAAGETLFSTKVINDESQILTLIETARHRAEEVQWAVDIPGRPSTLLLALLIANGQRVVYVPGRTVNRMSGAYRGEGKTDARTPGASPARPACARSAAGQIIGNCLNAACAAPPRALQGQSRRNAVSSFPRTFPALGSVVAGTPVAWADLTQLAIVEHQLEAVPGADVPERSDRLEHTWTHPRRVWPLLLRGPTGPGKRIASSTRG